MTIYIPSTNYFNESRFIVDSTAGEGRFTTIQAAINAATAGETVFIRPGTYTENITLKDGVNLTAFTRDTNIVTISGTITMNAAGTVTISGITCQTNGATAVSFSSANNQSLTFTNCNLTSTNANLVTNSNTNASSLLTFTNCSLSIAATYKCIDASHTGQIRFNSCSLTGASTTASTSTSSGIITFLQGITNQVFSLSGTTILFAWGLYVTTSNVTFLTVGTGASGRIYGGQIGTGSAVIFNITSTGNVEAYNVNLGSSNASTVTGTGTFFDGGCSYTATRNPATTTKQIVNNEHTGFFAQVTGGLTNVTGDGTIYTIIYNTEVQDFGGNYNPATGVYTAPYTGWYQFNASAFLNALTASFTSCAIYLTTPSYEFQANQCNIGAIRNASNQACLQISRTIYMTAGQTCVAKVIVSGSTKTVGFVNDSVSSTFTGKLVLT